MNKYFSLSDKVFDVTEKYPELIDLFVALGFDKLKNDILRKTLGKTISVETALKSKKLDPETFENQMIAVIENNNYELSSGLVEAKKNDETGEVKIMGVLPCPVRIQMLDKIEEWLKENGKNVNYELQSASMGIDWLKKHVEEAKDSTELADVYLSTGYSFFFDKQTIGKYKDEGVFYDLTNRNEYNRDFQNENIDLRDPKKIYSIAGVVPIVFTVNTKLLGDRPFPESWEDLLKPEFKETVAMPMSDLDMFNAVLLGFYKAFGKDSIAKLGRGLMTSMHPSQMVKAAKTANKAPIITVMPYFFSFTIDENSPMKVIWPKEGAMISPIFFLTKKENKEKVQPLVDFLAAKEMSEIMSQDGKFPSTNPELDNHLDPSKKFLWPGWELIEKSDMKALLKELEDIFYKGEA